MKLENVVILAKEEYRPKIRIVVVVGVEVDELHLIYWKLKFPFVMIQNVYFLQVFWERKLEDILLLFENDRDQTEACPPDIK